jgi:parvulin-like peptidyl-prolyl isomerase
MSELKTKLGPWAAMACGASWLLAGCGGGDGESAIAVVAGEPITRSEYIKYLETKPSVNVRVQGQQADLPVTDTIGFQAVRDLIGRRILMQYARDLKLEPTEQDILKEIKFREAIDPQYLRRLQGRGLSMQQIKGDIKFELAQERLITRGITVTMDEVEKYIKDNPNEFVQPATVDLRWVVVTSPQRRQRVDAELSRGADFVTVATQFSEFANARRDQARFPGRELNSIEPRVRQAIEKVSEGQITGWVELEGNFAKFLVERKTERKNIEMTAERKELLRRDIARRRGAQANDLSRTLEERMTAAKIDIRNEFFREPWKRALEEAKDARGMDASRRTGDRQATGRDAGGTEEKKSGE